MSQRAAEPQKSASSTPMFAQSGLLQRKCACGGYIIAGGECEGCKREQSLLQRHPGNSSEPSSVPDIVNEILHAPGHTLDSSSRAFMESRFGQDFSQVRVHTDRRAAESAHAVNALAYTVGRNVGFGTGQYAPHSEKGRHLLAHELTHVVQQATGLVSADAESKANSAADQILRGKSVDRHEVGGAAISIQKQHDPWQQRASSKKDITDITENKRALLSECPPKVPEKCTVCLLLSERDWAKRWGLLGPYVLRDNTGDFEGFQNEDQAQKALDQRCRMHPLPWNPKSVQPKPKRKKWWWPF